MQNKTKFELISDNADLLARLAKVELRLSMHFPRLETRQTKDMTKRRHKNEMTRDSETRYRRVFETAKDGILILMADTGQIIDVNPFLIELLGYSLEEFLGKRLWEIGLFKDIAASQTAFRELQRKQYIRYESLPLETKAGVRVDVEFVSNVYRANDKQVIQCNIRDITERVQAKNKIRKANEELSTLVAELQKHDNDMQLINAMNDLLQTCKTQSEAYQIVSLAMGKLFGRQSGALAILNASGQYLETVAHWGADLLIDSIFSLDDCWAMRRGKIHEVKDPKTDILCQHFIHPPETGYLCLPLVVQGETMGLFYLTAPPEMNVEFSISREQLIRTVCEVIQLALSNLRLREVMHEQATHDSLTGLFNRRYLVDTLPRELHRALRHHSPISIVMIDIDHFKNFNDTFGHEAGDLILREVGRILRENVRQSDIACRYGGEEFVLILPDALLDISRQHVEKIRACIKALQVRYQDQLLNTITLSTGIAQSPDHGQTTEDLLRAADKAMFAAKMAGRDRIAVFNEMENQPE